MFWDRWSESDITISDGVRLRREEKAKSSSDVTQKGGLFPLRELCYSTNCSGTFEYNKAVV